MENKEIIKALECSVKNKCPECPYFHSYPCDRCKKMQKDALDLITRQQAEIEELKSELKITREYLHNNGLEWDLLSYATRKEMVGEQECD